MDPRPWLEARLGTVSGLVPLSGGNTHAAFRAEVDGTSVFVKVSRRPHPFHAEALGLDHLRSADTELVLPRPLAHDDHHLVLTWLPPGPPAPPAVLGRALADLHRHTAPAFGFPVDGSCGATPQANDWCDDWPTFYAGQRILPLLRRLDVQGRPAARRLLSRLPTLLATDEPPALIHGDLWSGNHLFADGGHALVDPAPCYAHRELELGMMTLFGGFDRAVYEAYQERWPLPPGWEERVAAYRLYHLLNHAVLFGGAYRRQALDLMSSLV